MNADKKIVSYEQKVRSLTKERTALAQEILQLQSEFKSQTESLRSEYETMSLALAHKEDELKSMQRLNNSLSKQKSLLQIDNENMSAALKDRDVEIEQLYNQFDFERDYLREEIFDMGLAVQSGPGADECCEETDPKVSEDEPATALIQAANLKDAATQSGSLAIRAEERLMRAADRVLRQRRAHSLKVTVLRGWSRFVYERQIAFSRRETVPAAAAALALGVPTNGTHLEEHAAGARKPQATRSVETFADLDLQYGWTGRLNEIMAISLSELQELVCRQNLQIVNLEVR